MVTSIQEIKNKAVREVEITGFDEGEMITLKLRSISLMKLMEKGNIPNALLGTAVELFEQDGNTKNTEKVDPKPKKDMTELSGMIDLICESSMVEPTYSEISEYLTDKQRLEIFHYSQSGVTGLKSFREIKKTN
jgi:hypothetical protein